MSAQTELHSWVESANGHPDFPLANLPLGVFSLGGDEPRGGVAIGDFIFDLAAACDAGLFAGAALEAARSAAGSSLNAFFARGASARMALRTGLCELLGEHSVQRTRLQAMGETLLKPMSQCRLHLPARVGDYTDFYVGIHHANNVGKLFRPDNPLLPNYKYVPIGYHGARRPLTYRERPFGGPTARPCRRARASPSSARASGSTTSWSWEFGSDRVMRVARQFRSARRPRTWRASAC